MRHGIAPVNSPGHIDSGYRGEILVPLINHDPKETFRVQKDMRVAQLVLVRVEEVAFAEVELPPAADGRGEAGFGSSGS